MRVLFAGTPQFAVPSLRSTADQFEVCCVLTSPIRPSGRGQRASVSPVQSEAERLGIPVKSPAQLDAFSMQKLADFRADILVVAAYGLIFTKHFLELFPYGTLNVHPSLLPRHRGAAPIPAAILADDRETGVSIQRVVRRVDSGPILNRRIRALDGTETTEKLTAELAEVGADLLIETLNKVKNKTSKEVEQIDKEATYCSKVTVDDGQIDWHIDDAFSIERMVRAFTPWPHAHCRLGKRRLNLLAAKVFSTKELGPPGQVVRVDNQCGILLHTVRGGLGITELQLEGRRALDWRAFANGYNGLLGARLT